MELNRRQEIAVGIFTGSIFAFFIIIYDLVNTHQKLIILAILIMFILISFKLIRCPSISLQFIGDMLKKIGF